MRHVILLVFYALSAHTRHFVVSLMVPVSPERSMSMFKGNFERELLMIECRVLYQHLEREKTRIVIYVINLYH